MKTLPLDPSDFVILPRVAVLDEFQMVNDDGSFKADITPVFLDRLCDHMNERESLTGDLSPIVIGHTEGGEREIESPPVVGFARNWTRGILGDTGRQCAFADFWVRKDQVALARNYPRRSAEVWVSRHEIDPISLLGATTPARDLGLMRLSREGGVKLNYQSPGDLSMPADVKPEDGKPNADPKNGGEYKELLGEVRNLAALVQQLLQAQQPAAQPAAAPGASAPGAGGGSVDDILAQLFGDGDEGADKSGKPAEEPKPEDDKKSRKEEPPPVQNDATAVKLQRQEEEIASLKSAVARGQVKDALNAIRAKGLDVNPNDEALIADLVACPPDMRVRQLDRLEKLSRPLAGGNNFGLNSAMNNLVANPDGTGPRRMSPADQQRVLKLARDKNISFEQAAESEGFSFNRG